jgi:hypothetical protein
VKLTGTVTGAYDVPDETVERAVVSADLDYHPSQDQEPRDGTLHRESTFTDIPPHDGTVSSTFDLSLIDDWGFESSDFVPDPGSSVEHEFLLVAGVKIYDTTETGTDAIASSLSEAWGTITVTRPEENDDTDPSLKLTESAFTFEVVEE